MPTVRAFTQSSIRFERNPADAELFSLLGDTALASSRMLVVENDDGLIGRAEPFPLRFAIGVLLVTGAVITALPWIVPRIGDEVPKEVDLPFISAAWLIMLLMSALLFWINNRIAKSNDYFRVEREQRSLVLPESGKVIAASEMLSITELSRWYRNGQGDWEWTRQIGVVVRTTTDSVEWVLVARENAVRLIGLRPADQLGEMLGVPVRRMRLSWWASRALRDWK